MLSVLASGTLVSDPVARTGASGKEFVTALVRVPTEGDALLVSAIAFDPAACAALLALRKGEAVSVSGRAQLSRWSKEGAEHTGLSLTADRVLTAYQAQAQRQRSRAAEAA